MSDVFFILCALEHYGSLTPPPLFWAHLLAGKKIGKLDAEMKPKHTSDAKHAMASHLHTEQRERCVPYILFLDELFL